MGRLRLAAVIDAACDVEAFVQCLDHAAYELAAVLILPSEREMGRHVGPSGVRYATHPNELQPMNLDICVAWRGDLVMERHGGALSRLSVVEWSPDDLMPRRAVEGVVVHA